MARVLILVALLLLAGCTGNNLQPLSRYVNVTYTGDSGCLIGNCEAVITITMMEKPANNVLINTEFEAFFGKELITGTLGYRPAGKNITKGLLHEINLQYELSIIDSQNCTQLITENGPTDYCSRTTIPFTQENIIARLKNVGDQLQILLTAKKGTGNYKWGFTISDITIDPVWGDVWGHPFTASTNTHPLDASGDTAAYCFTTRANDGTDNITGFDFYPGSGTAGTSPCYRVYLVTGNASGPNSTTNLTTKTTLCGLTASTNRYNTTTTLTPLVAGNTYCLRVEYASGTVSGTNYRSAAYFSTNSGWSIEGYYARTNLNQSLTFWTSTDNSTFTKTAGANPIFTLYNGSNESVIGNNLNSINARLVNGSDIVTQNFTIDYPTNYLTINISNITIGAYRGTGTTCRLDTWIVNDTVINNTETAWRSQVLGNCSANVTSTSTNAIISCLTGSNITLNNNATYSLVWSHTDSPGCTVNIGSRGWTGSTNPGDAATFQGATNKISTSANNGTTLSPQVRNDAVFAFLVSSARTIVPGNVSFVQYTAPDTTTGTSRTMSLTGTTAGNTIVVILQAEAIDVKWITPTATGLTFTNVYSYSPNGNITVFEATNIGGGSYTIYANTTAGTSYWRATAIELSPSTFDTGAGNSSTTGTPIVSLSSVTAGSILLAINNMYPGNGPADTGYTLLTPAGFPNAGGTNYYMMSAYKPNASSGTQTVSWGTGTGFGTYTFSGISYKASGAGGGGGGGAPCAISASGGIDYWPCGCPINATRNSAGSARFVINGTGLTLINSSITGYDVIQSYGLSAAQQCIVQQRGGAI